MSLPLPSHYTTCEDCRGKFPFILRNGLCRPCTDSIIAYLDSIEDTNTAQPCIAECGGTATGQSLFCEECRQDKAVVKEDQDISRPKNPTDEEREQDSG